MARRNTSSRPIEQGSKLPVMNTCTPGQQYTRQRISDTWEPAGFARFPSTQALLQEMSVLGGPTDGYNGNPDRYQGVGSLEEDFPIRR